MEEIKEKSVSGEFKTRSKFLGFTNVSSVLKVTSKEAIIEGKFLSGLGMDDVSFKLTIHDDHTVSFDEVDTNRLDKNERERILEVIYDKTIIPYNGVMLIKDLKFSSTYKIAEKYITLYLMVESNTPMQKLASLMLSDDSEEQITPVSSAQLSKINSLFSDDETELETNQDVAKPSDVVQVLPTNSYQDSIKKSNDLIKEEKLLELKNRLFERQKDLDKAQRDFNSFDKRLTEVKEDIKLLESRIESMVPAEEFNGYYFSVSEKTENKVELSDDVAKFLRERLSLVKSVNVEGFMKLFERGIFEIKIGERIGETGDVIIKLEDNLANFEHIEKLKNIGIELVDNKFIHHGDLSWGSIINKLERLGFAQDPEFNKSCGSNSYNNLKSI
jgi:ribosome recycling factor